MKHHCQNTVASFRVPLHIFLAWLLSSFLLAERQVVFAAWLSSQNASESGSAAAASSSVASKQVENTLDLLYLVPSEMDDVLQLNEASTFGSAYSTGWLLPSDTELTLYLYLYYEGLNERRLNLSVNRPTSNRTATPVTLYMFFTTDANCDSYRTRATWPYEITEQLAANLYRAQLTDVTLPFAHKPYSLCMQQFDTSDRFRRIYVHQGDDYWVTIVTTRDSLPVWVRLVLFVLLLCLSGLFSGLNLGLMSLDLDELNLLRRVGTAREQSLAAQIYPLRQRGNFLLCTILLGNVLVNAVSTLMLGDMVSGVYAAIGSTLLIVVFGEIIPQAACSKHGLRVGAYTRYVTYFFMALTSPLSYPVSLALDRLLGQEITAVYNREKMRELLKHVRDLDERELRIISGALDFNRKPVRDVMTRLDDVFMLEKSASLDFETIARIAQQGFSRIPVYETQRENVVGLLHVKDFTLLDPDDNMPVKALLDFYSHAVCFCHADKRIDEMFEEFRVGAFHLAFVTQVVQHTERDPYDLCVGIVTLEDILEELVQMEIYDEFDDKQAIEKEDLEESRKQLEKQKADADAKRNSNKRSNKRRSSDESRSGSSTCSSETESNEGILMQTLKRDEPLPPTTTRPPMERQTSHDLSFFLQQAPSDEEARALISPQIRFVMFQFLSTTVQPFTREFLSKSVLELMFRQQRIFKESPRRLEPKTTPCEYLYRYGRECNYFVLILSGEATIEVGRERLEFAAGPFAFFGVNALMCGCETIEQVLRGVVSQSGTTDSINNNNNRNNEHNVSNRSVGENASSCSHVLQNRVINFVPDFSLRVDDRCVYIKIDRELWRNALIRSHFETLNNNDNQQTVASDTSVEAAAEAFKAASRVSELATEASAPASPALSSMLHHSTILNLTPPLKVVDFKKSSRSTIAASAFSFAHEQQVTTSTAAHAASCSPSAAAKQRSRGRSNQFELNYMLRFQRDLRESAKSEESIDDNSDDYNLTKQPTSATKLRSNSNVDRSDRLASQTETNIYI